MGQPLRSCLRAARHSGLTSPDLVRTPDAARQPAPAPQTEAPDKPQNRQRQAKHAVKALTDENGLTNSAGGLRLSSKGFWKLLRSADYGYGRAIAFVTWNAPWSCLSARVPNWSRCATFWNSIVTWTAPRRTKLDRAV